MSVLGDFAHPPSRGADVSPYELAGIGPAIYFYGAKMYAYQNIILLWKDFSIVPPVIVGCPPETLPESAYQLLRVFRWDGRKHGSC